MIQRIDLLKIDAEGNELDIIKGARRMIEQQRVACIQFEFGECDVYSRVFLKDFYDTLPSYSFFRICSRGLIPLGQHKPQHEIFQYQNIVAVDKASRLARKWKKD